MAMELSAEIMKTRIKKWTRKWGWDFLNVVFPAAEPVAQLEYLSAEEVLARLKPSPPGGTQIKAFFDYREPLMRKALHEIKYRGNVRIIDLFGEILYQKLTEYAAGHVTGHSIGQKIILIPIPLSAKRFKERGFNQCELLCRAIVTHDTIANFELRTDILQKIRHTDTQTSKKRSERLQNLRGCFAMAEEYKNRYQDKTIILLDDVITTGSTLREAASVLAETKAKIILPVALAH
jgi:ComF family protein